MFSVLDVAISANESMVHRMGKRISHGEVDVGMRSGVDVLIQPVVEKRSIDVQKYPGRQQEVETGISLAV